MSKTLDLKIDDMEMKVMEIEYDLNEALAEVRYWHEEYDKLRSRIEGIKCSNCEGKGTIHNFGYKNCPVCKGAGKL